MASHFLLPSYAVIAVIVLIGLMGPRTSIAKPSSSKLLPVEAQPLPRQMYTNSSSLQALGNSNQADITIVSYAEEEEKCGNRCAGYVGLRCNPGCTCTFFVTGLIIDQFGICK